MVQIKVLPYDPSKFSHWEATTEVSLFPFRKETFITTPNKAKTLLGWKPIHNVEDDLAAEVAVYQAKGGFDKAWGSDELRWDEELVQSLASV